MLTEQEIFDKSIGAILKQGVQSAVMHTTHGEDFPVCKYAGPNNTGCAIGVLLPRDVAEAWDNIGTFPIYRIEHDEDKARCITDLTAVGIDVSKHDDLLTDLQRVHDAWTPRSPSTFNEAVCRYARDVALDHNLSTAILAEFEQ